MDIVIEKASISDCAAIGKLIRNELGYPEVDDVSLAERLRQMESDPKHTTLVARKDGAVVGFIGLYTGIAYELEGTHMRILALAVDQACQNCGIGSLLLARAEALAAEHKVRYMMLNSGLQRLDAHRFYERHGYIKKGYSFRRKLS